MEKELNIKEIIQEIYESKLGDNQENRKIMTFVPEQNKIRIAMPKERQSINVFKILEEVTLLGEAFQVVEDMIRFFSKKVYEILGSAEVFEKIAQEYPDNKALKFAHEFLKRWLDTEIIELQMPKDDKTPIDN